MAIIHLRAWSWWRQCNVVSDQGIRPITCSLILVNHFCLNFLVWAQPNVVVNLAEDTTLYNCHEAAFVIVSLQILARPFICSLGTNLPCWLNTAKVSVNLEFTQLHQWDQYISGHFDVKFATLNFGNCLNIGGWVVKSLAPPMFGSILQSVITLKQTGWPSEWALSHN